MGYFSTCHKHFSLFIDPDISKTKRNIFLRQTNRTFRSPLFLIEPVKIVFEMWMSPITVFFACPTKRTSVAQGLFKVGPCTGPKLRYARHSLKSLGSRQHTPKKGHLRRQAINLAPSWRVRNLWGRLPEARRMLVLPHNANAWSPRLLHQAASTDYRI